MEIIIRKKVKPLSNIVLLKKCFENIEYIFNNSNAVKIIQYLKEVPLLCSLNKASASNRVSRSKNHQHIHPIGVSRGEIYNLEITEGVGSELSGSHLVIIIQNKKGNIYSEKVNVLLIEGDGKSINQNYQMELLNDDLLTGTLNKDPSRIILTDISTYDKARLKSKIGKIKPEKMKNIDAAIKRQLSLK